MNMISSVLHSVVGFCDYSTKTAVDQRQLDEQFELDFALLANWTTMKAPDNPNKTEEEQIRIEKRQSEATKQSVVMEALY